MNKQPNLSLMFKRASRMRKVAFDWSSPGVIGAGAGLATAPLAYLLAKKLGLSTGASLGVGGLAGAGVGAGAYFGADAIQRRNAIIQRLVDRGISKNHSRYYKKMNKALTAGLSEGAQDFLARNAANAPVNLAYDGEAAENPAEYGNAHLGESILAAEQKIPEINRGLVNQDNAVLNAAGR